MTRVTCAAMLVLIGGCSDDAPASPPDSTACDVRPGDGTASEFLDLHVYFMEPALGGKRVALLTYDDTDSARVYAEADVAIASDGRLEQFWTDAYRRSEYQPISFYVDIDGDESCTPGVDLGKRHISGAWNPVGDAMLDENLATFQIPLATSEVCADVARCIP